MDTQRIENAVRELLAAIGEDPEREGLRETPRRVARMYEEVLEGIRYSNEEIAAMFGKCFTEEGSGGMVVVNDIPAFSFCEHHLALMYNMRISVGYLPAGRVIGLSKIARIADMVCRRLQLQERIGSDIADIMTMATGSPDVAVLVEAEHSCMTARGIRKPSSSTRTICTRGRFEDPAVLNTFFALAKQPRP